MEVSTSARRAARAGDPQKVSTSLARFPRWPGGANIGMGRAPPPPHPNEKVSTSRVLEVGVPERKGFHGGEITHRGMVRAPTHPPHRHSADGETFQKVSPWTRFTETTERFPRRQGDRVNVSPPPICAPQSRRRGNLSKPPGKMFPRLNGGPEIAQVLVT